MSDQRYLDKFNDAVRAITTTEAVMNVSELIIKQAHGDISIKSVDEKLELIEVAQSRFLSYG